jgi:hypothetical protein
MQYLKNFWIFISLACALSTFAQNPVLMDRDWYLNHFTLDGIDDLTIKPNPVENILFINSKEAIKSIFIYDISGNLIMNSDGINSKDIKVDMSYNKSGIYLLIGETYHDEKIIKKIIKL